MTRAHQSSPPQLSSLAIIEPRSERRSSSPSADCARGPAATTKWRPGTRCQCADPRSAALALRIRCTSARRRTSNV